MILLIKIDTALSILTQIKVPFPHLPYNTFPPTADLELLAVSPVAAHEKPIKT